MEDKVLEQFLDNRIKMIIAIASNGFNSKEEMLQQLAAMIRKRYAKKFILIKVGNDKYKYIGLIKDIHPSIYLHGFIIIVGHKRDTLTLDSDELDTLDIAEFDTAEEAKLFEAVQD